MAPDPPRADSDFAGPTEPAAPVGVLEMDRFCETCGYNMRTQPVTRDGRTGILICRCTECGTLHPAGAATDAGRVWLGRLGTMLLMLWIVFLISLAASALGGLGTLQFAHLEAFTRYESRKHVETVAGRTITRRVSERTLRRPSSNPAYAARRRAELRVLVAVLIASSLIGGVAGGTMLTVFLWHLRRRTCYLALSVPFLLAGFDYWIWSIETTDLRAWGLQRLAGYACLQAAGLAVGILLGRATVRAVLRLLLPASLLQHLAFLWHADGRVVPSSRRIARE